MDCDFVEFKAINGETVIVYRYKWLYDAALLSDIFEFAQLVLPELTRIRKIFDEYNRLKTDDYKFTLEIMEKHLKQNESPLLNNLLYLEQKIRAGENRYNYEKKNGTL